MQTLTHAASAADRHLNLQESVDNGRRAIELDTGEENPFSYVVSHWFTAMSLLAMGDRDAARPHALAMRDFAERRGTPRLAASHNFTPITYLSCFEGDWKAGREYGDRGMKLSPLNPLLLAPRVLIEHETGESAQGEVYLERLLDFLNERINETIDEQYSRNLSRYIQSGLALKASQGYAIGSAPLGYRTEKHASGRGAWMVPDETTMPALIHLLEGYASGQLSYRALAQDLNVKGYLTSDGQPFTESSISTVLNNRFYAGEVV